MLESQAKLTKIGDFSLVIFFAFWVILFMTVSIITFLENNCQTITIGGWVVKTSKLTKTQETIMLFPYEQKRIKKDTHCKTPTLSQKKWSPSIHWFLNSLSCPIQQQQSKDDHYAHHCWIHHRLDLLLVHWAQAHVEGI